MENNLDFFQRVFEICRMIPYGRVTSYGAIAKAIGAGGAARMVGWAMNQSHGQNPPVPAHRVVNRIGMLSGKMHFEDPNAMKQLLESEGIKVENNQVVDFKEKFWDPQSLGSF